MAKTACAECWSERADWRWKAGLPTLRFVRIYLENQPEPPP
jgi:hypothetical protein